MRPLSWDYIMSLHGILQAPVRHKSKGVLMMQILSGEHAPHVK